MAISDRPTMRQIGAYLNLVQWKVTSQQEKEMKKYLETHCTRGEMSTELGRVRDLFVDRKLTRDNVFDSSIWDGFLFKEVG